MRRVICGVILLVLAFSACSNQLSGDEIIQKMTDVIHKTENYRVSAEVFLTNEGGFPGGPISGTVKNTGVIDMSNSAYHIDTEGSLAGESTADVSKRYVANDITYNYIGGQWSSHPVSPGDWKEISSLDLVRLSDLIDGAEVEVVGTDNINGTACYVIVITLDLKNLYTIVMNQPRATSQDPDSIQFWDDMEKSGSAKLWVATESYAPVKAEYSFNTILTPEQFGQQAGNAEIKFSQSVTVKYYDFNKANSVEVPAEALATP